MNQTEKDKANELTVLSDNTAIQRRFYQDRLDRNNISQEEYDKWLVELTESHSKKLLEILKKYENV